MAAATGSERADLEIDTLDDLPAALGLGGRDLS
jgi:hypothetical protein